MRVIIIAILFLPFFAQAQQACLFELEQPYTNFGYPLGASHYVNGDWLHYGVDGTCGRGYISRVDSCGNIAWTVLTAEVRAIDILPDSSIVIFGINIWQDDVLGDDEAYIQLLSPNGVKQQEYRYLLYYPFTNMGYNWTNGFVEGVYFDHDYYALSENGLIKIDSSGAVIWEQLDSTGTVNHGIQELNGQLYCNTSNGIYIYDTSGVRTDSFLVGTNCKKLAIETPVAFIINNQQLVKYDLNLNTVVNNLSFNHAFELTDLAVGATHLFVTGNIDSIDYNNSGAAFINKVQKSLLTTNDSIYLPDTVMRAYALAINGSQLLFAGTNSADYTYRSYLFGGDTNLAFSPLEHDAGITSLRLDNVTSEYNYTHALTGVDHAIVRGDLYITITNFGSDTLRYVNLHGEKSGGINCVIFANYKAVNTLALPPDSSQEVFFTDYLNYNVPNNSWLNICAFTSAPNQSADINRTNDSTCGDVLYFVGIIEPQNTINLTLSPNPVHRQLAISTNHTGALQLQLLSISGKTLLQQSITGNQTVDVSHLNSGLYMAVVRDGKGQVVYREKIVKL